jgi:hypothetical protein
MRTRRIFRRPASMAESSSSVLRARGAFSPNHSDLDVS